VLAAWAGVQRDRAVGPGVGKDTGAFRKGLRRASCLAGARWYTDARDPD
jgi:hypothetical protein